MSITIVVMPACFGASGLVRTVASPRWQYWAPLVHTFCPLTTQPPSTRVSPRRHRRRIGPGVGLAEQLAPDVLPHERLEDPALHLVRGGVLVHRHDVPPGDAEPGDLHPGRTELLVDHDLLDGAGGSTPGPGPVWDEQARLHQRLALLGAAQPPDPLGIGPHLGPHRLRLRRQVQRDFAVWSRGPPARSRPPHRRATRAARSAPVPGAGRGARRAPR